MKFSAILCVIIAYASVMSCGTNALISLPNHLDSNYIETTFQEIEKNPSIYDKNDIALNSCISIANTKNFVLELTDGNYPTEPKTKKNNDRCQTYQKYKIAAMSNNVKHSREYRDILENSYCTYDAVIIGTFYNRKFNSPNYAIGNSFDGIILVKKISKLNKLSCK